MARLAIPKREDLSPEGQEVWDQRQQALGGVRGPSTVLLRIPPLSARVSAVGDYLRTHGSIAKVDHELVILATVREGEARYAWQAHEPAALAAGARPEVVEAIRANAPLDGLNPHERILVGVVRSLFRDHAIPRSLYQQALAEFGEERLIELVTLAGYYGLLGLILNGFEVDLQAGATPAGF